MRASTGSPCGRRFSIRIFHTPLYVAKIATQLFDGILAAKCRVILPIKARSTLEAAAILHDVGRAEGQHNHQKSSYPHDSRKNSAARMDRREMEIVASIARYHRGAFPNAEQKSWAAIPADSKGKRFVSCRNSAARNCAWKRQQFRDFHRN